MSLSSIATHLPCEGKVRVQLEKCERSGLSQQRYALRSRTVLAYLNGEGKPLSEIVKPLGVRTSFMLCWVQRFRESGFDGLKDKARTGRPITFGEKLRDRILKILDTPPPKGRGEWCGVLIAEVLNKDKDTEQQVSVATVNRYLVKYHICLSRRRTWCQSKDPLLNEKMIDIITLYIKPPLDAEVECIDEKPNIQANEKEVGYVLDSHGKVIHGEGDRYIRHGTVNLFASFNTKTGRIYAKVTPKEEKTKAGFLNFLENLLEQLPSGKELHVIADNHSIHKKIDSWLKEHPQVHIHYTPTNMSWLNLVEVWFGILCKQSLKGASFKSKEELTNHINAYVESYNKKPIPFSWRKREIRCGQLSKSVTNLCA